jgi:hypothetical protein
MYVNNSPGTVLCTDTPGLLRLAQDAHDRDSNRRANLKPLRVGIDPEGFHVLAFQLIHNDCEWRTMWFIKIRDHEQPVELWLDVDMEILEFVLQKKLTAEGTLMAAGGDLSAVEEVRKYNEQARFKREALKVADVMNSWGTDGR